MSRTVATKYKVGASEILDAMVEAHPGEALWIVHGIHGTRCVWLPKGRKTSNRMMAVTEYYRQYAVAAG